VGWSTREKRGWEGWGGRQKSLPQQDPNPVMGCRFVLGGERIEGWQFQFTLGSLSIPKSTGRNCTAGYSIWKGFRLSIAYGKMGGGRPVGENLYFLSGVWECFLFRQGNYEDLLNTGFLVYVHSDRTIGGGGGTNGGRQTRYYANKRGEESQKGKVIKHKGLRERNGGLGMGATNAYRALQSDRLNCRGRQE